MSVLYTQCPGDTVQTGTGKVDPTQKFKFTAAARVHRKCIIILMPTYKAYYELIVWLKTLSLEEKSDKNIVFHKPFHNSLKILQQLLFKNSIYT